MTKRSDDPRAAVRGAGILIVVGMMLGAGLMGCSQREAEAPVLARVDESRLTLDEFLEQIPEELRPILSENDMQNYVRRWVDTQLFYKEALRRRLDTKPEVMAKLENLRREILVSELLNSELEERVNVTDEDVAAYYREHEDEYATEIKVAHILVSTPEEAQRILEELEGGADFAELAKAWSIDESSSQNGGELRYFTRGSGVPEFEDACFALELGETSGIVETGYGYHIIRSIDRRPARRIVVLDEIREELRGYLLNMKQEEVVSSWLEELRRNADIELNLDLLHTIEPAVPGAMPGQSEGLDSSGSR
jgi:peptidyl-prolyl cis-trans isomerase C